MDQVVSLRIPAELKYLAAIRRFLEEIAQVLEIEPETVSGLVLAVDEASTNIIRHGYQGTPGLIEMEIAQQDGSLVLRLRDQAPAFDPTQVPDPDLTLPLEKRPLGGLGVFLIKQFTDEMIHRELPQGGNELTLVKRGVIPGLPMEELQ